MYKMKMRTVDFESVLLLPDLRHNLLQTSYFCRIFSSTTELKKRPFEAGLTNPTNKEKQFVLLFIKNHNTVPHT